MPDQDSVQGAQTDAPAAAATGQCSLMQVAVCCCGMRCSCLFMGMIGCMCVEVFDTCTALCCPLLAHGHALIDKPLVTLYLCFPRTSCTVMHGTRALPHANMTTPFDSGPTCQPASTFFDNSATVLSLTYSSHLFLPHLFTATGVNNSINSIAARLRHLSGMNRGLQRVLCSEQSLQVIMQLRRLSPLSLDQMPDVFELLCDSAWVEQAAPTPGRAAALLHALALPQVQARLSQQQVSDLVGYVLSGFAQQQQQQQQPDGAIQTLDDLRALVWSDFTDPDKALHLLAVLSAKLQKCAVRDAQLDAVQVTKLQDIPSLLSAMCQQLQPSVIVYHAAAVLHVLALLGVHAQLSTLQMQPLVESAVDTLRQQLQLHLQQQPSVDESQPTGEKTAASATGLSSYDIYLP